MIKVTLEYPDVESFMAAMAKLSPTTTAPVVPATVAVEEPVKAPKPAKVVKAEKPAATPPASEMATSPTTESAASAPVSESHSEISYDDVAALVIKCSKANGRPFVVDLLKPFGITSLTAAKPEQFADIKRVFEVALV